MSFKGADDWVFQQSGGEDNRQRQQLQGILCQSGKVSFEILGEGSAGAAGNTQGDWSGSDETGVRDVGSVNQRDWGGYCSLSKTDS